jgi:hypothetical protein
MPLAAHAVPGVSLSIDRTSNVCGSWWGGVDDPSKLGHCEVHEDVAKAANAQ